MSNQAAGLQAIACLYKPFPRRSGAATCAAVLAAGLCRPDGRRRLRGGLWPSLPPLGGLLPLHPQTPLRYARHCMAAYAAAAHPAAAGRCSWPVPRNRLCGGCSPWPTHRPPVPVSRRARTRPGGRRGAAGECCGGAPASRGDAPTALFRPPCRQGRRAGKRKKCTNQETGAADVAQPSALVKGKTSACGALDKRGRLNAVVIRA